MNNQDWSRVYGQTKKNWDNIEKAQRKCKGKKTPSSDNGVGFPLYGYGCGFTSTKSGTHGIDNK